MTICDTMPANDLEQSVDRTVDETRANQTASPPLTPNRHALDGERQPPRTRNRGGAPKGNKNRTTHGLKGSQLPPKCIRDQFTIRQIVNAVIDACEARHGHAITVHQSAIIHRIRRAATRDRLAARWLRLEGDKLPIEQRMALTEQMEAAAETIEKCLRLLKLDTADAAAADPFAKL